VLVQVTKDPIGHKGARLTSQVSLPGRFLVYVPDGTTSGISRKLPDTERNRLKTLLKEIVPDTAGVIVRTAAEGASEQELTRDVERLTARWGDIQAKVKGGNAPQLLYGEPDLTLKVVRDLFTEDFGKLVVSGDDAWDMVDGYVQHVAPDLADRLERYDRDGDVFSAYRIDEQIAKALDRKVWLPSGGSLIIDRTEAMTVIDVNTGKFTGSGGNLEETVTKNNLEAAEEIVRQLRLRDIGGIIVVDFIDMVLESNRDLVLRRMVECLGRDRTRHQVAEVTSLGLVQMTRKRIGTGLLEAFSETCEHCQGRGTGHLRPRRRRSRPWPSRTSSRSKRRRSPTARRPSASGPTASRPRTRRPSTRRPSTRRPTTRRPSLKPAPPPRAAPPRRPKPRPKAGRAAVAAPRRRPLQPSPGMEPASRRSPTRPSPPMQPSPPRPRPWRRRRRSPGHPPRSRPRPRRRRRM
jgi:ribonuclease E